MAMQSIEQLEALCSTSLPGFYWSIYFVSSWKLTAVKILKLKKKKKVRLFLKSLLTGQLKRRWSPDVFYQNSDLKMSSKGVAVRGRKSSCFNVKTIIRTNTNILIMNVKAFRETNTSWRYIIKLNGRQGHIFMYLIPCPLKSAQPTYVC